MTRMGRYEILEEVGRGGFATVYKARDLQLNRLVALKILHSGWNNDLDFVRRFQQEAETVANLKHPDIVVIYDVGEVDRQLYIAMEYLAGENLQIWLANKNEPLPITEAIEILFPIASALDYAHSRGIIHRDIKPSNILRDGSDDSIRVVLADFGLVKAMENSVALTMTSQMLGSPEYMSPEQADPNRLDELGPYSDLYAFGIVAYRMLVGRVPFPGHSISTLNAHVNLPVPDPQQFNPDLSDDEVDILDRMLAKIPNDRYPTAMAFVKALQATVATETQEKQREEQVVLLYAQLRQAQAEDNWIRVISLAAQIELLIPGYRDVEDLQAAAQQRLQKPFYAASVSEAKQKNDIVSIEPSGKPNPNLLTEVMLSKNSKTWTKYVWAIIGVVGIIIIGLLAWGVTELFGGNGMTNTPTAILTPRDTEINLAVALTPEVTVTPTSTPRLNKTSTATVLIATETPNPSTTFTPSITSTPTETVTATRTRIPTRTPTQTPIPLPASVSETILPTPPTLAVSPEPEETPVLEFLSGQYYYYNDFEVTPSWFDIANGNEMEGISGTAAEHNLICFTREVACRSPNGIYEFILISDGYIVRYKYDDSGSIIDQDFYHGQFGFEWCLDDHYAVFGGGVEGGAGLYFAPYDIWPPTLALEVNPYGKLCKAP